MKKRTILRKTGWLEKLDSGVFATNSSQQSQLVTS